MTKRAWMIWLFFPAVISFSLPGCKPSKKVDMEQQYDSESEERGGESIPAEGENPGSPETNRPGPPNPKETGE